MIVDLIAPVDQALGVIRVYGPRSERDPNENLVAREMCLASYLATMLDNYL